MQLRLKFDTEDMHDTWLTGLTALHKLYTINNFEAPEKVKWLQSVFRMVA